jgi:XTP/dITP diphosphohydrolase
MPDLLLASNNPGKLMEIKAILREFPINIFTPGRLNLELEVAEGGTTYRENAYLKASAFAAASGLVSLADDSGLEVDVLDGSPGLHSARLSSKPNASDADRRHHLLTLLMGKPRPWSACFRSVVAIAAPVGEVFYSEGICQGEIIPDERGAGGFGYDPIFLIPEIGKTMAELSMTQKNRVSHRGQAVNAALPILVELFKNNGDH